MAIILSMHRPQPYTLACVLVSIGGLLFGLDTGCIGPITTMPAFLDYFGDLSSTIHGLLVSSILIPASLTSFFAGSAADALGRVRAIGIGGIIFALGTALEASAQNLAMLFVGRCITGVGEGLFLSTLVVYVCEIAPAKERGVLASVQQLLVTIGICGGYFICYGTVRAGRSSLGWRLPFALQSFLALIYGASVLAFLPQSPRWLKSRGKYEEATEAWARLGVAHAETEEDKERTHQETTARQPEEERKHNVMEPESLALTPICSHQSGATKSRLAWLRIFAADVRARTLLAAFLMGAQQAVGIDGVLYYVRQATNPCIRTDADDIQAPLLFQQAGLGSSTSSFLASGISALLMMIVTIPAFLFADKWGRRTSTLWGGVLLSSCMLAIGSLYASDSVHGSYGGGRWAVIVLIYIFALTYSATWAVCIKVYASEIQPLRTRAPASSLAQSSNWIVNWIVAFTTPIFLARSTFGVYFLFGAAGLLTTVVCAFTMPETRGRSLEDIEEAFHSRRHSELSSFHTFKSNVSTRIRARKRLG